MDFIKKNGAIEFLLICGFLFNPFNFGFLFGYGIIVFIFMNLRKFMNLMDFDGAILMIFSFIYTAFYLLNPLNGPQFIIIYLLFPTAFYLTGKNISKNSKNYFFLFTTLLLLTLIYSSVSLISVLLNIYNEGFVRDERNVRLIWGNTINATGTAAMLFANMCIPAILLFIGKKMKTIKSVLLIIVFLASVFCSLRLGSRTQIALFVFTFSASLIYFIFKQSASKKIITFVLVFLGINLLINFLNIDYDSDLLSAYATRMESKQYGASTAGGRTQKWAKSLENMIDKPLGWSIEEFGYSHNLWLDVARSGTLIAFIFLLIFSLLNFKRIYQLLKNKSIPNYLRNMFLVYFIAFFLQFFVEPILDGSFELFVLFCLFMGVVNQTKHEKIEFLNRKEQID